MCYIFTILWSCFVHAHIGQRIITKKEINGCLFPKSIDSLCYNPNKMSKQSNYAEQTLFLNKHVNY